MQFSLWMVEETLQPYRIRRHIQEEVPRTIENIRLYAKNTERRSDTLYVETSDIFFENGKDTVICLHGSNYLEIETASVNLVFNQILQFFEETQNWETALTEMITSGCLLKDVLNHFQNVLPLPLMVLDHGQVMLASSEKYGIDSIDEDWNLALQTGSFHMEKLESYNKQYYDRIQYKHHYVIPADPFPYSSFNHNIYIESEFVGFISMILLSELKEVHRDWFDIACHAILNWISLYMRQNEIVMRQEAFTELLEGRKEHLKSFSDAMSTAGWQRKTSMRILVVSCISDILNMNLHIARMVSRNTASVYAIDHQKEIVMILKEELLSSEEFKSGILQILEKSGYYGGLSDPFTDFDNLDYYYRQACIALSSGDSYPGKIYSIRDHMLPYIFELLSSSTDMSLKHPALEILQAYDRQHHSGLYHVLDIYLQTNCSQTETAKKLYIHRNSLIRKIDKISALCDIDLEDYETRLHLMISYRI